VRLLPEYSSITSLLLALPYKGSDWDAVIDEALECYRSMVTNFLQHDNSLIVQLLAKPGSDWASWLEKLCRTANLSNAERSRLVIITDIDYDDTWIRDYGPLSFIEDENQQGASHYSYKSFNFNGWGQKYSSQADNQAALALVRYGIAPQLKSDFVIEGGGLEINGKGVLLVNRDCVVDDKRNAGLNDLAVSTMLYKTLGLHDIKWLHNIQLTGDDTDGHIDTIARFINDDTVVCCGRNRQHHDAEALEALNRQLEGICNEQQWTLHTVPMPIVRSKVDDRLLPATYANFLICNGHIYVPTYGAREDAEAISTMTAIAPNYTIVPIRCEALLEQHGSLHCATMQIAGDAL